MRHALVVAPLASAFSSVEAQWQFTVKKDEMTDEKRATLLLRASSQTRNAAGLLMRGREGERFPALTRAARSYCCSASRCAQGPRNDGH